MMALGWNQLCQLPRSVGDVEVSETPFLHVGIIVLYKMVGAWGVLSIGFGKM